MPATELASAPGPEGTPSRLCLAVWCTPGFSRLAGIWANRLTFMSRTAYTVGMRRMVPMAALLLLALPAMAARRVAVVTEGELAPPARHGLAKLREALRAKGFELADSAAQADYVILAGIGASAALQHWNAPMPVGREAVTIWR